MPMKLLGFVGESLSDCNCDSFSPSLDNILLESASSNSLAPEETQRKNIRIFTYSGLVFPHIAELSRS